MIDISRNLKKYCCLKFTECKIYFTFIFLFDLISYNNSWVGTFIISVLQMRKWCLKRTYDESFNLYQGYSGRLISLYISLQLITIGLYFHLITSKFGVKSMNAGATRPLIWIPAVALNNSVNVGHILNCISVSLSENGDKNSTCLGNLLLLLRDIILC